MKRECCLPVVHLLVAVLLVTATVSHGDKCSFNYLTQPPTDLPCNPYAHSLLLECSVAGPTPGSVTVVWYRVPSGLTEREKVEEVAPNNGSVRVETRIETIFSGNGAVSRLEMTGTTSLDVLLAGDYWCQIMATNGDTVDLSRSAVTTVQPREFYVEYSFPDCLDISYLHQAELACAESVSLPPSTSDSSEPTEPQVTTSILPSSVSGCSAMTVTVTVASSPDSSMRNESSSSDDGSIDVPLAAVMLLAGGLPIVVAIVILIVACVLVMRRKRRSKESKHTNEGTELVTMATTQPSQSASAEQPVDRRPFRSQSLPPRPHLAIARVSSSDSAYEDMIPESTRHRQSLIKRLKAACIGAPRPLPPLPLAETHPLGMNDRRDDSGTGETWTGGSTDEDGPSLQYAEPETRPTGLKTSLSAQLAPARLPLPPLPGEVIVNPLRAGREDRGMAETWGMSLEEDGPSQQYAEPDTRPTDQTSHASFEEDKPCLQYQGLDPDTLDYMGLYVRPRGHDDDGHLSLAVGGTRQGYQLSRSPSLEPIIVRGVKSEQEHYYY